MEINLCRVEYLGRLGIYLENVKSSTHSLWRARTDWRIYQQDGLDPRIGSKNVITTSKGVFLITI